MSIAKKLPEIACTAGEKMQIETTATKHAARIETRTLGSHTQFLQKAKNQSLCGKGFLNRIAHFIILRFAAEQ